VLNQAAHDPIGTSSAAAFAAATGGLRWDEFLEHMGRVVGAHGGALFSPQPGPRPGALLSFWGTITGRSTGAYFSHWIAHDPWNAALEGTDLFVRAGTVRHGHEFLDDRSLRKTTYFNDFSRHVDGGRLLCLKVFGRGLRGVPETHVTLSRRLHEPPFEPPAVEHMQAVAPALQRALLVYYGLRYLGSMPAFAESALATLPQPTWLLRADCTIDYSNPAAEALTQRRGVVRVRAGRLMSVGVPGDADLGSAAREVATSGIGCDRAVLFDEAGRAGVLRLAPLTHESPFRIAWPDAAVLLQLETAARGDATQLVKLIARRFKLTASERDVLERLAGGDDVYAIARQRACSTVTVRTHLRALFDKTGLRRQADLVRLAHGN
jgi:DNA-binding CsgD family transcriptional regulator